MRRKQEVLADQARELKSTSESAWNEIKSGVDREMSDLKESIKQAAYYFL